MAWIRQLPSGLWAATVYTPNGRITESHELKSVVKQWSDDLEADVRRGEFIDPRGARTPVRLVWEQYGGARRLEKNSRARDESTWKCWVDPRWGNVQVGAILKPEVQTWVNELEEDGVGGWTIVAALNVLKAVLELAVDAGLVRANTARRVKAPLPPAHVDRVLTAHEESILLDRLDELFPGRRDGRLFVETLLDTGGRWEEIAAVKREAVDLRRGVISLGPVMERDGTVRDYPKGARSRTAAGFRDAPLGDELLGSLKPVVLATPKGGLVYTAPLGGPLRYPTWLRRVWNAALRLPVVDDAGRTVLGDDGKPAWTPLLEDPQPTPHDCRHTLGTRLRGLDQAQRMAILGHVDHRSDRRYVHADDDRFDEAREAVRRARAR